MSSVPAPWLESGAARLGVGVIVALSIGVGWNYWQPRNEQLAQLTVGAELIAFAGLAVAASHRWSMWGRKIGAILVTAMAAGWCGYTMYQSIDADTRAQALADARERPAYVFAANAAQTAATLLSERLTHPSARPECACPDTLAQWEASESAAIERLRNERDAAIAQMERATPEPLTDWGAIARGISVEIAKLLGFMVFGIAVSPTGASARKPDAPGAPVRQPKQQMSRILRIFAPAMMAFGGAAHAHAQPTQAPEIKIDNAPITLAAADSPRAVAFSMRGRVSATQIAQKIGVHRATVNRWFAARDKAMAAKAKAREPVAA